MNSLFRELDRLLEAARRDESLRRRLLDTRAASDPMDAFCSLAQSLGYEIYLGDLFAAGQEYSDNQCKSTNGGNPRPYDSFSDTLEFFLAELEQAAPLSE
ncbi:MAG TPA: Nif11 family protein [Candidatus Caccousia avicola]|uniref:Nif11 family protein n=1 Tax=Candidatus Caccousia avicola TaxID=2840721 RepID=A0A9D1DF35_9FIRM|nr:Nif11 family protein [Candidatus Caccousia avicola]